MGGPPPLVLFSATVGLIATMLTVLLWWGARALTAPLARFASAAGEFSLDRDPLPLAEDSGPDEVRTASRALNRMQARIRSMIENRTRMLAAVSHDLRTPITRMRLRAEFIDQDETRRQMVADLDQMDRMVHAALSYLRDGASVILVSSADADKQARVGTSIYVAAKDAVRALARSMAVELLPRRIRVNVPRQHRHAHHIPRGRAAWRNAR